MRKNSTLSILIVASAAAMCVFSGCDGCGCDKTDDVVSVAPPPAAAPVQGVKGLPAVPVAKAEITPDSPDEQLAEHYGISLDEIRRIKAIHSALPGISKPAASVPERKLKSKGAPGEVRVVGPVPYESDKYVTGADRVTAMPQMQIITGHEFVAQNIVTPGELAGEVDRLRKLLFNMKSPVFSEPVVIIDSKLEKPGAAMNLTVGFPVPNDFKAPPGIKVRRINAGKAVFANSMLISDLTLSPDLHKLLTGGAVTSLLGKPCVISAFIDIDGWPKADSSPTGNGYFYCL